MKKALRGNANTARWQGRPKNKQTNTQGQLQYTVLQLC